MARQDPLRGFRFLVEIDGIASGGFTRVKGLSREVKHESYREGGVNEYEHKLAHAGLVSRRRARARPGARRLVEVGAGRGRRRRAAQDDPHSPAGRGQRARRGPGRSSTRCPVKWSASDLDAQTSPVVMETPRARASRTEEGDMNARARLARADPLALGARDGRDVASARRVRRRIATSSWRRRVQLGWRRLAIGGTAVHALTRQTHARWHARRDQHLHVSLHCRSAVLASVHARQRRRSATHRECDGLDHVRATWRSPGHVGASRGGGHRASRHSSAAAGCRCGATDAADRARRDVASPRSRTAPSRRRHLRIASSSTVACTSTWCTERDCVRRRDAMTLDCQRAFDMRRRADDSSAPRRSSGSSVETRRSAVDSPSLAADVGGASADRTRSAVACDRRQLRGLRRDRHASYDRPRVGDASSAVRG